MKYIKHRTLFLATLLAFSSSLGLKAGDIYVAQVATGNSSGSDANNCISLFTLNTRWTAIGGDMIHLVGVFTNQLNVAGSGASNQPVTLYFETGASFTSPRWPSTGAINLNGKTNIIIDGGVNGLIQNTDCGTGLTYSNDTCGIVGAGYFITIQNLTITNIYKRTSATDYQREGIPVSVSGSDITVTNCTLSDGDGILVYSGPQPGNPPAGNIRYLNNRIYNYNHGLAFALGNQNPSGQNVLLTNVVISGNYIDHSDVWDDSAAVHHMDAVYLIADTYDPTVVLDGFILANNTFGPHVSNQSLSNSSATAVVGNYFAFATEQIRNSVAYNNLVLAPTNGSFSWQNAFGINGSNVWFINNTVNGGQGVGLSGKHSFSYNNLVLNGAFTMAVTVTNDFAGLGTTAILSNYFTDIWADHNVYVNANPYNGIMMMYCWRTGGGYWTSGQLYPISRWNTYGNNTGFLLAWANAHVEPNGQGVTSSPAFNVGTYIPAPSDTILNGKGTNLTAVLASFGLPATDLGGIARPATGNWTIGAYQVTAEPFVSLNISTNNTVSGNSVVLSWASINATNLTLSGVGSVAINGSMKLTPAQTTTYVITASGANGTSSASANVVVRPLPPPGILTVTPTPTPNNR